MNFGSFGDVAFVSTTISLCHRLMPLKKTKLPSLAPPDHDIKAQVCLAATQTPSGKKSEEIEEIARVSMAPGEVEAKGTADSMIILRAKGGIIEEPPYSSCSS